MWVIDPLDGTSEYFRNLISAVYRALLNGMQGEIGVIYNSIPMKCFVHYGDMELI